MKKILTVCCWSHLRRGGAFTICGPVAGMCIRGGSVVGVEELLGNVGKNGSATRGDATLGDEGEEASQKFPEIGAALGRGEFRQKLGGEVERIAWGLLAGGASDAQFMMTEAKTGSRVQSGEATPAAADGQMGASALRLFPPAPASREGRGKPFVAVLAVARASSSGRGKLT